MNGIPQPADKPLKLLKVIMIDHIGETLTTSGPQSVTELTVTKARSPGTTTRNGVYRSSDACFGVERG